ncbi:hypothetical protein QBC43DRAFT_317261 [Cladorrhinum sp. PSN259]|nr:hypothetical protein QBC43DRAFT_317261 [Cladorrhinum sp. PSN259]
MNARLLFPRRAVCLFHHASAKFSTIGARQKSVSNDELESLVLERFGPPKPSGVEMKLWSQYVKKLQEGLNTKSHLKGWAEVSEMSKKVLCSHSQWQETDLKDVGRKPVAGQKNTLKRGEVITVVSWNLDCEEGWDPAVRASTCMNLLRQSEFGTMLLENRVVIMLQKVGSEAFGAIKNDPWVQENFAIAGITSSSEKPAANHSPEFAAREQFHRESDSYLTLMAIPRSLKIAKCFRVYRGNQSLQGKGVEYLVVDLPVASKAERNKTQVTIRLCTSFCDLPYIASPDGSTHIFRRHVGDVTKSFMEAPGHQTVIGGLASVDVGRAPGFAHGDAEDGEFDRDGNRKQVLKVDKPFRLHHPVHYDIHLRGKPTGPSATTMDAFIFGKYDITMDQGKDSEREFNMLGGTPRYWEEGQDSPVVADWFLTRPLRSSSISTRISCKRAALLRQQMLSASQGGVNNYGQTLTARINEREPNPWNHVHSYPGHVSFFRVPVG